MTLQYTPEGEYGEGPGYYSYGGNAPMLIHDLLALHAESPALSTLTKYGPREMAGMYASANWSRQTHPREIELGPFNFNDLTSGALESSCVIHWIASRTQNPAHQAYGDQLFELRLRRVEAVVATGKTADDQDLEYLSWSLLFRDPAIEARADDKPVTFNFGRFGTVISRTGYTDRDLCLILRCGEAAGAHSHCDAGTFMLEAYGERIVAEGGKPLDRSIPEYMTYHRKSAAHNVSFIDGQGQIREHEGKWFAGKITKFNVLPDGFSALCDLSHVYATGQHAGTGQHVIRRFTFSQRGWIMVHDIVSPLPTSLTTLLHTDNRDRGARIEIEPDRAVITRARATMHVFPLIASGIRDTGTHFQDGDREGLRSLEIGGVGGEVAYLLAVTPRMGPGAGVVSLVKEGSREFLLSIGGIQNRIMV